MSISEELASLGALHQQGVLSDEEFTRAKARVIAGADAPAAASTVCSRLNGLHRARRDRWVGGVGAGLAQTSGIAAWIWRLLFVVLATFGGTGLVLYGLLWLLVPDEAAPRAACDRAAYG
jgi:phage shock protein PspC (stress-responsive transcriptional regulator)